MKEEPMNSFVMLVKLALDIQSECEECINLSFACNLASAEKINIPDASP